MTGEKQHSPGVARYIEEGKTVLLKRLERIQAAKKLKFDTIAVHGLYSIAEMIENNQGSIIEPLYLSTSQAYRDSDEMEAALAYLIPTWCYTRIANPTVYYLEWTVALLEGYGTGLTTSACATSSGLAAIAAATEPFLVRPERGSAPNFVATCQVYGGTFQQFSARRTREQGIECRWVDDSTRCDEWAKLIDDNTRFLYGELPSNPGLAFFDIRAVAELAHSRGLPLIVDATVATPALLRPLQHGADIVIHSITKSMTMSGLGVGGVVVSRNNIVTEIGPPEMRENFAEYIKFQPNRDMGWCISPSNAHFTLTELRTLRMKMDRISQSSMNVAHFLEGHPMIETVDYLGLESHPLHALARKYLVLVDSEDEPGGPVNRYGHLLSFTVKGDARATRGVLDRLNLIIRATDLGRIKSVATIPAITTHQQQGEEARRMAGIPANLIRLCVGGEHPDDIIRDLDQALKGN